MLRIKAPWDPCCACTPRAARRGGDRLSGPASRHSLLGWILLDRRVNVGIPRLTCGVSHATLQQTERSFGEAKERRPTMTRDESRPWRALYRPGLDESAVLQPTSLVVAWRRRVDA